MIALRRREEKELEIRILLTGAALALAAGCDAPPEAAPRAPRPERKAVPDRAPQAPAARPEDKAVEDYRSDDAAAVLRAYYAAIAAGDYTAAWALRSGRDAKGLEQFETSFADFAEYRADIGIPGQVVSASGASYVDIPVQIHGRRRSGEPFVTAGTVTLRRAEDGPWRIHAPG